MDKPLSLLLVEDEPAECTLFIQAVEVADDVSLVGVTNNADKALEYVKDFMPDAVVLDLELHKGSGSGVAFLSELRKSQIPFAPYVLVTTNNISRITHEHVRQLGADFIMVKSQDGYSAESVVEFLRSLKEVIRNFRKRPLTSAKIVEPPGEVKKRISARLSAEIDMIGVSPKAVGRGYLVDAINLVIDGNSGYITEIAQNHGKTDASVERAMQNAISNAWRSSDIEELQRYYTARISSDKGVPTLTEFIYYYANKIKTEY